MIKIAEDRDLASHHRVTVIADVDSDFAPSIALAVAVAAAQRSNLHGLFVEDVDLLTVASLPFTEEVPLQCGRPRELDQQVLQRLLNNTSRTFRELLADQAGRSSLLWSYSTVRGRKQCMQLGEFSEPGLMILGAARRMQAAATHSPRILLFPGSGPIPLSVLDVVLGRVREQAVEVLLAADSAFARATPQLEKLVEKHPGVTPRLLTPLQVETVFSAPRLHADYVIVTRDMDAGQMSRILALVGCPVIVLS